MHALGVGTLCRVLYHSHPERERERGGEGRERERERDGEKGREGGKDDTM